MKDACEIVDNMKRLGRMDTVGIPVVLQRGFVRQKLLYFG